MAERSATLRVRVHPRASKSEVVGFRGDALHVKVTEAPERGKANDALLDLLSDTLRVPKSKLSILRGHASRDKWIEVDGASQDELQQLLGVPP